MIAADGLTKFYGDKCAIQDLSFEIADGEIVGILGLNGAGKATTLKILASLLLPSSGSVRIKGTDVVESPHEARKLVGFLPESPPLYTEMSVEAYLRFVAELRGLTASQTSTRLDEVLEWTHTKEVRHQTIGTLSHGFRQRVGIAQAVIHDPPVVILDEPISGLDPAQIKEMRAMVRSLAGKHTLLLSSHILSEISQTCDRILVIHDGRIVASGTEDQLAAKGHRLQLTVRGDQEKILAAIRSVDGVTACTVLGQADNVSGDAGAAVSQLRVETNTDTREVLARELVQGGFGLLQLSPAEAELESAFLQLTRTGAAIAEPPAAAAKEG